MKKKSDLDSPEQESKLPFQQVKDAYRNIFETASPLLPVKNILSEYNLGVRKGSVVKRINEMQISPKKLKIYEKKPDYESSESDDEDKIELEEHEKERIEKERVENLIKTIEKWLCNDEEGLFMNNSEIEGYMKTDESLELIMEFISDPLKILIDSQVILYFYKKKFWNLLKT